MVCLFCEEYGYSLELVSMDFAGILPVKDETTEWISNWPATISMALVGDISAEECMQILNDGLNP